MSEQPEKTTGGFLKGAVSALALCGVGSLAAIVAIPVKAPEPAPQIADMDPGAPPPPVMADLSADLSAPAEEAPATLSPPDNVPTSPAPDRDSDQVAVEAPAPATETQTVTPEPVPATEQVADMVPPEPESAQPDMAAQDPISAGEAQPEGDAPEMAQLDMSVSPVPAGDDAEGVSRDDLPEPTTTVAVAEIPVTPEAGAFDPDAPEVATETDTGPVVAAKIAPPGDGTDSQEAAPAPVAEDSPAAPRAAPARVAEPEPEAGDADTEPPLVIAAAKPEPDAEAAPDRPAPVSNPILAETDPAPAAPEAAAPASGPAFSAYAVTDFTPQGSKPFLSIVIEYVGADGVEAENLADLAVPVSFAIPSHQTAPAIFRERGFETVAVLTDADGAALTQAADPGQVAARVEAARIAAPEAVAMMERPGDDIYRNPRLVSALTENLIASGHGYLVFERFGAGAAVTLARDAEVPTATVLRVLDETRDSGALRRALDRAALEASKTGAAIVYARSYPETISTLLPWLLSNTARSIQIAPLTATVNRASEG